MQEKDIVLDGQNVAFCHGKTKARELKRKGFFSYDGLKISATTLYNNGYRAKIILPEFWCRRNKTKRYDGAQEVIEYLREKELIIEVKGDEADQIDARPLYLSLKPKYHLHTISSYPEIHYKLQLNYTRRQV